MECKTASLATSRRPAAGFTLVETLIAIALFGVFTLVLLSLVVFSSRGMTGLLNYSEMEAEGRQALDRISREIRESFEVTGYTTNSITLLAGDAKTLTFAYDAGTRQLTRTHAGQTRLLLRECDGLAFTLYSRGPIDGVFDTEPTDDPALAKLVEVSWECSRTILGKKLNTKHVVMSRTAIRSK